MRNEEISRKLSIAEIMTGCELDKEAISKEGILASTLSEKAKAVVAEYNNNILNGKLKLTYTACLCGENRSIQVSKIDRYGFYHNVVICERCGLLYANPRPDKGFLLNFYSSGKYREVYGSSDMEEGAYGKHLITSRDMIMIIVEAMKGRDIMSGGVLDFGCGGGWNLEFFRTVGINILGVDLDPAMVEIGKRRGLNLVVGSFEKIVGKKFGVIILNHVIEHLTDFWNEILILRCSLTPGGLLYVSTPNISVFGCGRLQNVHNYYFTMSTMRYFMQAAGFRLINYGYMYNFQDFYCIFEVSPEPGIEILHQEKEKMKEFLTTVEILGKRKNE